MDLATVLNYMKIGELVYQRYMFGSFRIVSEFVDMDEDDDVEWRA